MKTEQEIRNHISDFETVRWRCYRKARNALRLGLLSNYDFYDSKATECENYISALRWVLGELEH